jgi:hypothetical protein
MTTQTTTKQAITIATDNKVEVVQMPAGTGSAEYEFLSASVGGWIEMVTLVDDLDGIILWVNEEGKINNLDYNPLATTIWETCFGFTDVIVGNAILTGGADEDGETLPLTDKQVATILALVK